MDTVSSRLWPYPFSLVAIVASLALGSCSDDTPVASGPSDHTAPRIVDLTPVDIYHVDVVFDEELEPSSAESWQNYGIVETETAVSTADAGDPMYVTAIVLGADHKTVSLTTYESMSGRPLQLSVHGVADLYGNATTAMHRSFVGSDQPDGDAPAIVRSTPSAGAVEVPIGTSVVIRFSEPIDNSPYDVVVTWTSPSGPVDYYFYPYLGGSSITMLSRELLDYNAVQTISLSGLKDRSGNIMPDTELSFTTATVADETPPTLISSHPRNNAVNVDENTTISLTFSEPINRYAFRVDIVPDVLTDSEVWSDHDRTITYTIRDYDPLGTERQYLISVYPGGVYDLGGNTVRDFQTVIFTTAAKLEQGEISGRIEGDPGTPSSDPGGAVVFAESWDTYNLAVVPEYGPYAVRNLQWGPYYVRGFLDSNRDGVIDIYAGDALGGFGADPNAGDYELEVVPLAEGRHLSGIDFQIYDPGAASGVVAYSGQTVADLRPVEIGLFSTATDAVHLQYPIAVVEEWWAPWSMYDPEWVFNQLFHGFEDGKYYLAAFIDADSSGAFEADRDPAGVYGGFNSPAVIDITNGKDYYHIVIPVGDPASVARVAAAVEWPKPKRNAAFQRFVDVLATSPAAQRVSSRK